MPSKPRKSRYPVLPLKTVADEVANALESIVLNLAEESRFGPVDSKSICRALRLNVRALRTRKLYY